MSLEDEFKQLLKTSYTLLGPNGCPWDREQTPQSLRPCLLEETHEVIEAIDENNPEKLQKELADLFFNALFLILVCEKEGLFKPDTVLAELNEKLIRRHPHVFKGLKIETDNDLWAMWEGVKKEEAAHADRKSRMDGIPKTFPALAKAAKLLKKQKEAPDNAIDGLFDEERIATKLWDIVKEAKNAKVDPELALLALLKKKEKAIRDWEGQSTTSPLS